MAEKHPSDKPNSFQTPNPKELQSPEKKDSVYKSVLGRQGEETEVVDNDVDDNFLQDDVDQPGAEPRSMSAPD